MHFSAVGGDSKEGDAPPLLSFQGWGSGGGEIEIPALRGFLWDPKPVSLASKKWVLSNPEPRHPPHPALRATFPSSKR